jgi:aminopeptidase
VVAAPNPGWAQEVFGNRTWSGCGTRSPRRCGPTSRTRSPPGRSGAAELAARGHALDALELTEVRYHGDGTDLTVGLVPDSRWSGGDETDRNGLAYMPNIPTEEVFTSRTGAAPTARSP